MTCFDHAALRVVHQDGEPSTTETIDAGDPGGVHSEPDSPPFSLLRSTDSNAAGLNHNETSDQFFSPAVDELHDLT